MIQRPPLPLRIQPMLNTLQHILNQIPIIHPKELRQLRRAPPSLLELARVRVGRARCAAQRRSCGGADARDRRRAGDGGERRHGRARGQRAPALHLGQRGPRHGLARKLDRRDRRVVRRRVVQVLVQLRQRLLVVLHQSQINTRRQ